MGPDPNWMDVHAVRLRAFVVLPIIDVDHHAGGARIGIMNIGIGAREPIVVASWVSSWISSWISSVEASREASGVASVEASVVSTWCTSLVSIEATSASSTASSTAALLLWRILLALVGGVLLSLSLRRRTVVLRLVLRLLRLLATFRLLAAAV